MQCCSLQSETLWTIQSICVPQSISPCNESRSKSRDKLSHQTSCSSRVSSENSCRLRIPECSANNNTLVLVADHSGLSHKKLSSMLDWLLLHGRYRLKDNFFGVNIKWNQILKGWRSEQKPFVGTQLYSHAKFVSTFYLSQSTPCSLNH